MAEALTPPQLQILQHALGVDQYGRGQQYRNHFCAGGSDETICRELVKLGYMATFKRSFLPYYNCTVTDEGKAAMLQESPNPPVLSRAQVRYRHWLTVADCFPDWKFGGLSEEICASRGRWRTGGLYMKSLTRQSDRAIQDLLGISTPCEMCDLLHIDIERQRELTADRESRLLFLIQLMFNYRREINMWKLLAFTGWVAAILMAWASVHHA